MYNQQALNVTIHYHNSQGCKCLKHQHLCRRGLSKQFRPCQPQLQLMLNFPKIFKKMFQKMFQKIRQKILDLDHFSHHLEQGITSQENNIHWRKDQGHCCHCNFLGSGTSLVNSNPSRKGRGLFYRRQEQESSQESRSHLKKEDQVQCCLRLEQAANLVNNKHNYKKEKIKLLQNQIPKNNSNQPSML